jgi:hypothetical protein
MFCFSTNWFSEMRCSVKGIPQKKENLSNEDLFVLWRNDMTQYFFPVVHAPLHFHIPNELCTKKSKRIV